MSSQSLKGAVPVNDLKRIVEEGGEDLLSAAQAALSSGWWLNGKETIAFCQEFAAYIGASGCIGVANGTDALEIAMRALVDLRGPERREVVMVANAGGYSTIACRSARLIPAYADIESDSQLMSLTSAVSTLSAQTALVVVTHLYGGVIDVARLRNMMDDAGYSDVPILEDCAQAHGVRLVDARAGSLGDVAAFSFYPTKNLGAFGDGGAIVTSDRSILDRCQALRQYGWSAKYSIAVPGGRNSRLDEVQAAILRRLLPRLDEANLRRIEILRRYEETLPSQVRLVRGRDGTVAHLAVVLCDDRNGLKQHLADRGVQSDIHYPTLDCDQLGWQGLPQRIAPDGLPVSRASVSKLLTLPCFPTMTETEIATVCDALAAWRP